MDAIVQKAVENAQADILKTEQAIELLQSMPAEILAEDITIFRGEIICTLSQLDQFVQSYATLTGAGFELVEKSVHGGNALYTLRNGVPATIILRIKASLLI